MIERLVKLGRKHSESSLPTVEELVKSERRAWRVKEVPPPPKELLQVINGKYQDVVRSMFKPHYMPPIELKTYSRFLDIGKEDSRKAIARLASDMSPFTGQWLLIDKSQRPDYDHGFQLYKNDYLNDYLIGGILYDLRKEGKIFIPEGNTYSDLVAVLSGEADKTRLQNYKHIPYYSRFAISYDEISNFVIPEVASRLKVKREQVGVPNKIEFYALGNLYHKQQFLRKPGRPDKQTWEWLGDRLGSDYREISSLDFSVFHATLSHWRDDRTGFRLVVRFPSKTL